jgi:DNA-binding NarL/FixJ family response regulator
VAVPVAVIDPLPVYQRGMAAILGDHGFNVSTPDDVVAWARDRPHSLVLLSMHSPSAWEILGTLCRLSPQPLVIAVTTDDTGSAGAQAIQLGVRSVLPRQANVQAVERAIAATMAGEAVMPSLVASVLSTGRVQIPASHPSLSAQQLAWLRALSEGRTVAALAKEAGYSERAMYRLLRAVYEMLGVRTRVEAIVRVQQAGWLAGGVTAPGLADKAG